MKDLHLIILARDFNDGRRSVVFMLSMRIRSGRRTAMLLRRSERAPIRLHAEYEVFSPLCHKLMFVNNLEFCARLKALLFCRGFGILLN